MQFIQRIRDLSSRCCLGFAAEKRLRATRVYALRWRMENHEQGLPLAPVKDFVGTLSSLASCNRPGHETENVGDL